MRETGPGFQVFDRRFDHGVFAMEPVDLDHLTGQVSEERMMPPIRSQFLLLGIGEPCPANNQTPCQSFLAPPRGVEAFSHLGFAVAGVVNVGPLILVDRDDCLLGPHPRWCGPPSCSERRGDQGLVMVSLFQNPESNRSVNARPGVITTEASNDFTNRFVPRWVFAEP